MDEYTRSPNPKRFSRNRHDRVIAGVCGGIADRMGWDPTLVRIATVVSIFTPLSGMVILGYVLTWMITPSRIKRKDLSPDEERFWRDVSDRPADTFSNIRYKFKDLDQRLQGMERIVTSEEWRLRRQFKDLERG
ncbi:MAG: envelope stress response membrane protein PspC [Pseudomonadota bacterium]